MPNQWRSIAPVIGRTAAQCVAHYEKLLDAAQQAVNAEDGTPAIDPSLDPRKLRPGEVDPTPEAKPARPDAVDMEEDEKEMLNEARARLANTKGKKAKRKAREKMMEEAKRLATLQKRRELRAAGIHVHNHKSRVRKDMDYNEEIPFQKPMKAGFYDINEEAEIEKKMREEPLFLRKTLEQLNGKRRADIENEAKKKDAKRQKLMKQYALPQYIAQINKINNPDFEKPRPKLSLPQPQISDSELQQISKMGNQNGVTATPARTLLSNIGATPSISAGMFTPARTPFTARTPQRTQSSSDYIMKEARDLLAWSNTETPLSGTAMPQVKHEDFLGVTPKRQMATPAATPLNNLRFGSNATPSFGAAPLTSSLESSSMAVMAQNNIKKRQASLKNALKAGFASLPAPKNEVGLAGPMEIDDEKKDNAVKIVEDMGDVQQRQLKAEQEAEIARLNRRSRAVQKDLPRPSNFSESSYLGLSLPEAPVYPGKCINAELQAELDAASYLIREEAALLIKRDAVHYPFSSSAKASNGVLSKLEVFSDDELLEARNMLNSECEEFMSTLSAEVKANDLDAFVQTLVTIQDSIKFVPSRSAYLLIANMTPAERIESLKYEWKQLGEMVQSQGQINDKEQAKLNVMLGGLTNRFNKLEDVMHTSYGNLDGAVIERNCFQRLSEVEESTLPIRLQTLKSNLDFQKEREKELQSRYATLLREHKELQERLSGHRGHNNFIPGNITA